MTPPTLKLTDYDVISFDLDNTLLEYNLSNLFPLQYEFLSNYMVDKKGYRRNAFPPTLTGKDADFILRGLFLDFRRGNILNLGFDGSIIKATHGTKLLSDEEVENSYGKDKKWSALDAFIQDKLVIWDNSDVRTFLDFTDSIVPLIFAKAVDSIDSECAMNNADYYKVWADILESVVEMYNPDSIYCQTVAVSMQKYAHRCSDLVLSWLKELKKRRKLLLITGAELEVVRVTLPFCFGNEYSEIFDMIICDTKKPGFFTKQRPFCTIDGSEVSQISFNTEDHKNLYRYGNWTDIHKALEALLGRPPKSLYIGDNPIQDVYSPTRISLKIDTIGIVEEIASEGLHPDVANYSHSPFVSSTFWGPFLCSSSGICTMMGSILKDSAKLLVPSVYVLAKKPIDYEHESVIRF